MPCRSWTPSTRWNGCAGAMAGWSGRSTRTPPTTPGTWRRSSPSRGPSTCASTTASPWPTARSSAASAASASRGGRGASCICCTSGRRRRNQHDAQALDTGARVSLWMRGMSVRTAFRVAAVQPPSFAGAEEHRNAAQACAFVDEAADASASYVVFPEGYPGPYSGPMENDAVARLQERARDRGVWVSAGRLERGSIEGTFHIAHVLVDDRGEIRASYRRVGPHPTPLPPHPRRGRPPHLAPPRPANVGRPPPPV